MIYFFLGETDFSWSEMPRPESDMFLPRINLLITFFSDFIPPWRQQ